MLLIELQVGTFFRRKIYPNVIYRKDGSSYNNKIGKMVCKCSNTTNGYSLILRANKEVEEVPQPRIMQDS
jgi:hypothetical protein